MTDVENATKRVFFNTTALTGMKILGLLIGFLVTPITIHELGMAKYGLWAIINGFVGYFTLLDFGAGSTFVTQFALFLAAGNQRGIREVMTFGIVFYLLLGILFAPVAWLIAPHLVPWFHVNPAESSMLIQVFWWMYAYLFVSQAVGGFGTLLNAAQRMVFTSVLGFVSQIINSVVLIIALMLNQSLFSFVFANYISLAFGTLVSFIAAHRLIGGHLTLPPWCIRKETLKDLFSFGGWMQINNLSNQINMETDRVLIGTFVSTEATGVYQLANKLALICRFLPFNLLGALLPAFSGMKVHGEIQKIRKAYIDGSRFLALMTFVVAGFTLAASKPITILWLGEMPPNLIPILALLLISYVINNLTGVGTTYLRAIAQPRLETYYAILGSVINLILTIILAPYYGMWGILWGTVIGSVIGSLYFLWSFQRIIDLSWRNGLFQWIWPIIVATGVACSIIYAISTLFIGIIGNNRVWALLLIILQGFMYLGIYLFVLRSLKYFTSTDEARVLSLIPDKWNSHRLKRSVSAFMRGV